MAPTKKQLEFHAAGAIPDVRFRCFFLGNQQGKTFSGGMEWYFHLSGLYPDWWPGYRFDRPIKIWLSGVTGEATKKNIQRIMLGEGRDWGSGTVPRDLLVGDPVMARGSTPDLVDSYQVRSVFGGSSLAFQMSYEKGREKWQGETLDGIGFDEEMPEDIESEGIARLTKKRGIYTLTATPLKGATVVVNKYKLPAEFLEPAQRPLYHLTEGSLEDCTFYSAQQKLEIMAQWPEHERLARVHGQPTMGEGLIYPIGDDMIKYRSFELPRHYRRLVGLDVGIGHPTAAVWGAYDPDTDTIYLYDCYKATDKLVSTHASAIKARGAWIPVSWPHDALKSEPGFGQTVADMYTKEGCNMLPISARYRDDKGGGQSPEAIILETLERMKSGRLKVLETLHPWFNEKAQYHRKSGKPVAHADDLMKAMHYLVMMLRYARPDMKLSTQRTAQTDYDPLSGGWGN